MLPAPSLLTATGADLPDVDPILKNRVYDRQLYESHPNNSRRVVAVGVDPRRSISIPPFVSRLLSPPPSSSPPSSPNIKGKGKVKEASLSSLEFLFNTIRIALGPSANPLIIHTALSAIGRVDRQSDLWIALDERLLKAGLVTSTRAAEKALQESLVESSSNTTASGLKIHHSTFQSAPGSTIWTVGIDKGQLQADFIPTATVDDAAKPIPVHCLYIHRDPTSKKILKAWILTAMRRWQPVTQDFEHPVFPDRVLNLTNVNGQPSWRLKASARTMQGRVAAGGS